MPDINIENKINNLLTKIITDMGYELYDVEYVKEGSEYHLCIYIDKKEGIGINDCEKVNEAINPILDEKDLIKDKYFLEVSSTGLEKKLRKKEHYIKQIGNKIELKLFAKLEGKKLFQGVLKEYNDSFLVITQDNNLDVKIELDKVASGKTIYNWDI